MRAAYHDVFGDPAEVMLFGEMETPKPGAGEVLVKTILSPIHNHDLWTIRGQYGYVPELPGEIGGSEAVGTVAAVGEGVDEALIGKRISVGGVHGSWAEYFIAKAATLVPLPESIKDEDAAQLIAMPFSAIALLDSLKVGKGEWLVQTAANGAVGKIMVSLAKARGINLLNLVRRAEAVDELKALGAEHVLCTSDEGWLDAAKALMGTQGAVSAIDSVGAEMGLALAALLGRDGEYVVFGTATGAPLQLPSGEMITKHLAVRGFWAARVFGEMDGETQLRLLTELVTLAAQDKLALDVGGIFELEQVAEAMKAAQTPARSGKIMLRA
ncbi:zinc-binding dehydrogenase [Alloyangia pacifica]|uniref:NADPH:quinone reductase n=1 Tax=Alloyangia pacifica TaxID=311180 RepID=A0A1I6VZW5_9RHOB|nr:zinc-binding dehydrogenase [Alloyangia pacifica]SDI17429.1 NADPH:quinone reductase [Alloyangia pacifica]SFT18934.1 NADPH:quinone reductase [Alloyangia pacifica]